MYLIYWTLVSIPLILLSVYAVFNLYRKIKVYENWILDVKEDIGDLYKNIQEVDSKNIFEKDDDVGVVFEQIKELISSFNKKVQD
jgi:biopolymer transport protein ExbB/TolQ